MDDFNLHPMFVVSYNAQMAYRNLGDFLESLSDDGLLARVAAEVDPCGELAEIARRSAEKEGPALLFERVRGCALPVVANLLSTTERACRALGVQRLDELTERTHDVSRSADASSWLARLKQTTESAPLERFRPKTVRAAGCQQIVRLGRDIDLAAVGPCRLWPAESHPTITGARLVVADGAGGASISPCRLIVLDATHVAIVDDGSGRWTRAADAAQAAGEKLPVLFFLGGHPTYSISSAVRGATNEDAYRYLGLVRGESLETAKARLSSLEVPADAELVLEGFLVPTIERQSVVLAGLAGDFYRVEGAAHVARIEALTQRTTAILPVVVGGGPEHAVECRAVERLLLPTVRGAIVELVDYALPPWGGGDRYAFLAIRKTMPLQARRAISAFWGLPAFQSIKFVVVVDEDVDVQNASQVWRSVGAHVDPGRDTFVREGPAAAGDHSFAVAGIGRQLAIDATRKLPPEAAVGSPHPLLVDPAIRELVERRWKEFGL